MASVEDNNYIRSVVSRHTPLIPDDVVARLQSLSPHIHEWANGHEYELKLAGSLAKGTGITGTTDADLFISLHPSVLSSNTLEIVYTTLRNRFSGAGFVTREQNVSLGLDHSGLKIDVVPGVKHHPQGLDHSIWRRKAQTWTKTNIDKHITYVSTSGRVFDIKAVKIWRKLKGLDFPSFYLELSVIEALRGKLLLSNDPGANFVHVMNYFVDGFVDKVISDPSNQANLVSDELTQKEKELIRDAAAITLRGQWNEAIW